MNRKIITTLLCSLIVVACGKSNPEKKPTPTPEPQPQKESVSFKGTIKPISRATDNGFENGDAIGVFAVEKTTSNVSGKLLASNYADNVKYVYSNGLFTGATSVIEQPTDKPQMYYKAIYPYSSGLKNEFIFTVNTDQSTTSNYTLSDLMTADTEATTSTTPNLVFSHKMSNIIINIQYEEKPGGSEQLKFNNVLVEAKANINENTFAAFGGTMSVIASENGNNSFKVVLPPQTIAKDVTLFTLKVGSKTFTFSPKEELIWRSGMQYTYDMAVNKDGVISFTSSINPWEKGE